MCSFRFSPDPRPSTKRSGSNAAVVAAAWATMAGWIRIVGHVTAVTIGTRSVFTDSPPSTLHTSGLCPCREIQGWKWSEIVRKSKPDSSAMRPYRRRSPGACSSLERVYPTCSMWG
jgi:hypothetical protein